MCETVSPRPNSDAGYKRDDEPWHAVRLRAMWRMMNTVTKPAAMNRQVATIDRGEKRARPQTP